jgi:hypothetical protein
MILRLEDDGKRESKMTIANPCTQNNNPNLEEGLETKKVHHDQCFFLTIFIIVFDFF